MIALNGTPPDGVSIDVIDPFRVFVDEGAPNPYPTQTKPAIILAGGRDVAYTYREAADGTKPTVLLVGGFGSNTLTGGTMSFGNFLPSNHVAQAHAHFADRSGFDATGQTIIGQQIANAVPPSNPSGVAGAAIYGSRGGLMVGGPGNNTFFAMGAGVYEMVGGGYVNSFTIRPSFNGVPASYQIDGGGGESRLVVQAPADENVTFENSTLVDKYNPAFKALAVQANAGLSATAHGIQKVHIVAAPGSSIELGDTSEVNVQFSITGTANIKLGGSAAPDVFDVSTDYNFYGKSNHRYVRQLVGRPYWLTGFYYDDHGYLEDFEQDIQEGLFDLMPPGPFGYNHVNNQYVNVSTSTGRDYIGELSYDITRTFGTTGKVETLRFDVGDSGRSSLTLDGKGSSDDYNISLGLGSFIDVKVEDSDTSTQNTLDVDFRHPLLLPYEATLANDFLRLKYFTPIYHFDALHWNGVSYNTTGYHFYTSSVTYAPAVYFGGNVDIALRTGREFQQTVVNRTSAPVNQHASIIVDGVLAPYEAPLMPAGWNAFTDGIGYGFEFPNDNTVCQTVYADDRI